MELSVRLQTVANMVTKGNRVADIGCDHGYVSIYLIEQNISPKVIAMDVNKGPLERAKEHVSYSGYTKVIDIRLSDGAKAIDFLKSSPMSLMTGEENPQQMEIEVDTLLIAGMGGRLIQRILTDSMDKVMCAKELILQPQSEIEQVRRFIREIGFSIVEENMILEEGKFYPMMRAILQTGIIEEIATKSDEDQMILDKFGPLLLKNKNKVLCQYLMIQKDKFEKIKAQLKKSGGESEITACRLIEIKKELDYTCKGLKYYEG